MTIYQLMRRKIERDGLTEECKQLLDVFFAAGRITKVQYLTLMGINKGGKTV